MDRDSSDGLLDQLRQAWKLAVCFEPALRAAPAVNRHHPCPCWFAVTIPGIDECSDTRSVQGAHWIKRQRVERELCYRFDVPIPELRIATKKGLQYAALRHREHIELIWLAAWDPRNGVPACDRHHKRFDGQTVRASEDLVVDRELVPVHVEAFCRDWGFETALEERNPAMGAGI